MIGLLLGWTKLPQWAIELVFVALLVAAGGYAHHRLIETGIEEQRKADQQAAVEVQKKADAQTADAKARADMAKQAYDKEVSDNANYRASHPDQPVRLCLNQHDSSSGVPQAGATVTGNAATGTAAGNVQPVPAGNSGNGDGAGPDIGSLLGLLAARADQVSATLREYQTR